ncbi:hypothetical protein [Aminipila sp.]|uniref:hypothetical protein n=1 Tax=Aminipila sp. TaxID=2060095 RepID=UPI00289DFBB5|nr:hypothetical protein [Aminipila sp.]
MKKITIFLLIGSLAAVLSLTGCGSSNVKELDEPLESSTTVQSDDGQELQVGQILSIKDDQVTITLGSMESGQIPNEQNSKKTAAAVTSAGVQTSPGGETPPDGQPPEKPAGQTPPDGQPPEKPDGQTAPQHQTPQRDKAANSTSTSKSAIVLTDETLTLTIDDSTVISYMDNKTSTAAISELKVGTTIAVQLDQDGKTAKQILIIE